MSTPLRSSRPDLSIVIVTYNSGEIVIDCLNSVFRACAGLAAEIIVVDNHSQDGTPGRIQGRFPQAHFIANAENRGFAAANNVGLSIAVGRFLLLLNPDVIVEPDALRIMVGYLQENGSVGVVGPRTATGEGKIAHSANGSYTAAAILRQFWGLDAFLPPGELQRQAESASAPFAVTWLQASCLMFRREVYAAIGGLDEGFFMFCEEPDFCDRAARAGWPTMYLPQAKVMHFESTTISRYPLLKMRHYHLSPLHYFRKRRRPAAVWLLKLGFVAELVVKYGLRRLQQALQPAAPLQGKIDAYPIVIREISRY